MRDPDHGATPNGVPKRLPPPIFSQEDEPAGRPTESQPGPAPKPGPDAGRAHLPPLPPVKSARGREAASPPAVESAGEQLPPPASAPIPGPLPPLPPVPGGVTAKAEPLEPATEMLQPVASAPAPVPVPAPLEEPAIPPMRTAGERAVEAGDGSAGLPIPDEPLWPESQTSAGEPKLDIPTRRRWPTIAAVVVAAVVVAAVLGVIALRHAGGGGVGLFGGVNSGASTGGQAANGGQDASGGAGTSKNGPGTPSGGATSSGGAQLPKIPTGPAPKVAGLKVAALVAYRAGGAIWVSGEQGENPKKVLDIKQGRYALSPDGTRLAAIDTGRGVLILADLETAHESVIGPAVDIGPAWAPDSSFFVYTSSSNGKRQVIHATRVGAFAILGAGVAPQVSPDGQGVYYLQTQDPAEGGILARVDVAASAGGAPSVVTRDRVVAFAPGRGVVYYATGQGATASIWRAGADGSGITRLVGASTDTRVVVYSDLKLSPNGKALVFARTSDDGYSRMEVIAAKGGVPAELSLRRDDYPIGWTTNGEWIMFVDGNATQGEKTDVLAVAPSGGLRRTVVAGGGL